jgi:tetratricopeptide (TPR) repeat protein
MVRAADRLGAGDGRKDGIMKLGIVLILLAGVVLGSPATWADQDAPLNAPDEPGAAATPESRLNDGLALADKQDWRGAEAAFRDALRLRSAFPEAWNGLGHALRMQKNYPESVQSYQEALRLRPDYPQALEYLGEAYVQMGKLDEARAVLRRLRVLDPSEAAELAAVIDGGGKASRRW